MRWLLLMGLVACGDNLVLDVPAISHGGDRLELYWNDLEGARDRLSRASLFRASESVPSR